MVGVATAPSCSANLDAYMASSLLVLEAVESRELPLDGADVRCWFDRIALVPVT